jgi:hypothetical protein
MGFSLASTLYTIWWCLWTYWHMNVRLAWNHVQSCCTGHGTLYGVVLTMTPYTVLYWSYDPTVMYWSWHPTVLYWSWHPIRCWTGHDPIQCCPGHDTLYGVVLIMAPYMVLNWWWHPIRCCTNHGTLYGVVLVMTPFTVLYWSWHPIRCCPGHDTLYGVVLIMTPYGVVLVMALRVTEVDVFKCWGSPEYSMYSQPYLFIATENFLLIHPGRGSTIYLNSVILCLFEPTSAWLKTYVNVFPMCFCLPAFLCSGTEMRMHWI